MRFQLCAACHRHVSVSEHACPFCGAQEFRSTPGRAPRHASRGQMLAAGLAASLVACEDNGPSDGGHTVDASMDASAVDASSTDDAATAPDGSADDASEPLDANVPIYDAVPPRPDPELPEI